MLTANVVGPVPVPMATQGGPDPRAFIVVCYVVGIDPAGAITTIGDHNERAQTIATPIRERRDTLTPPTEGVVVPAVITVVSSPPPDVSLVWEKDVKPVPIVPGLREG